jgi:histidine triad (HIT) family protein
LNGLVRRHRGQSIRRAGALINQFNGEGAGQTVFHTHFHIIPRHAGVPLKGHAGGGMADPDVLAEHGEKIRRALANN